MLILINHRLIKVQYPSIAIFRNKAHSDSLDPHHMRPFCHLFGQIKCHSLHIKLYQTLHWLSRIIRFYLYDFGEQCLTLISNYGKNNRTNNQYHQDSIGTRYWIDCSWHHSWNCLRTRCYIWSQRGFKPICNRWFDWRRKWFRWAHRPTINRRIATQVIIIH